MEILSELDPKSSVPPTPNLNDGEIELNYSIEIAICFNIFFIKITENYFSDNNQQAPNYEKRKMFIVSKLLPGVKFNIPPIHKDFVLKELNKLDPKKAVRIDRLFSKLPKMVALKLSTHVINLSIFNSRLCPIVKCGKCDDKSNHRQISILYVISKILEKNMYRITYMTF